MFERAANTNDGQFGVTRRGVSEIERRENMDMRGLGSHERSFCFHYFTTTRDSGPIHVRLGRMH